MNTMQHQPLLTELLPQESAIIAGGADYFHGDLANRTFNPPEFTGPILGRRVFQHDFNLSSSNRVNITLRSARTAPARLFEDTNKDGKAGTDGVDRVIGRFDSIIGLRNARLGAGTYAVKVSIPGAGSLIGGYRYGLSWRNRR